MAADVTVKQHDTYPPLLFRLADENGALPVITASSIKLLLNGPATITGTVVVIDPPNAEGMNAKYPWKAGETSLIGSYRGEVEITWDASATPPAVETIPNSGTFTLVIEADLG